MKSKHCLLSIIYIYKSCKWLIPTANKATEGDVPALRGGSEGRMEEGSCRWKLSLLPQPPSYLQEICQ